MSNQNKQKHELKSYYALDISLRKKHGNKMNLTRKELAQRGWKKHEPDRKNIYVTSFFKNRKLKNGNKNVYVASFLKNGKHKTRNLKKEKASTHPFPKRRKARIEI